jgi:hypothetical protein
MEHEEFSKTRTEIFEFWELKEQEGQFDAVKEDVDTNPQYKWKYM